MNQRSVSGFITKLWTYAVISTYMAEQRMFDWYTATSTAGLKFTEVDFYTAGTENWPYQGCQWPALSFVLRDLPRDGVFVDLGSGKGKALLIARRARYEKVIGVEIDSELTAEARRNIERARCRPRAGVVECVTASVVDWKVPDDTSVVFLHNPFFGETFKEAMKNIFESYDRNPRDIHIVYQFPWEHDWLLATGRVCVERLRPEGWPNLPRWWASEHVTLVYHVTGEDQLSARCRFRPRRLSPAERKGLHRWTNPAVHDFKI